MTLDTIALGELLLLMLIVVPATIAWVWSIVDNFGRRGGPAKMAWFFALIALPILGTFIYMVAGPSDFEMAQRDPRITS